MRGSEFSGQDEEDQRPLQFRSVPFTRVREAVIRRKNQKQLQKTKGRREGKVRNGRNKKNAKNHGNKEEGVGNG